LKALFLTTPTNDCSNHVRAFRSFAEADHHVMHSKGLAVDGEAMRVVREARPDIVFYISANQGPYALRVRTLRDIKAQVPIINLCSDAADRPWHAVLRRYAREECFTLQVALDGAKHPAIDISTLTPVDPRPFAIAPVVREVRCGFSGSVPPTSPRTQIMRALEWFGGLTIRPRQAGDGYEDHAAFLKRCQMVINTSWTGTGQAHHIKGRVLEAGMAGCALLEMEGSPIGDWFPDDCYFMWRDAKEAEELIRRLGDGEIRKRASRLSEEVCRRYNARAIYTEIMEKAGVDITVAG